MKRFYSDVAVDGVETGFRVLLDGRPIRTPGGAPQIVPTRALAEKLAAEWRAQGDKIDPKSFVHRDLADYAIDQVRPAREETIAALLAYAETDTLCYRADPDEPLFQRQHEIWEPLVAACEAAHAIRLERISGIVHRPQREATVVALRAMLAAMDDFTLAGTYMLASLAASLVVALAVAAGRVDPESLFAAANLEQDWQAQQWGWDAEAERARKLRLEAFEKAAEFVGMARPARGKEPARD